jgi:ethanolamine ammonia-lyase small subunit
VLPVHSAAPDRASYLLRPDLGRRLDAPSVEQLKQSARKGFDVLPIVADGLSSLAVSRHAPAVLEALRASFSPNWNVGPVVVAAQGRVALGDHIGELLQARLVVLLIGERPGLSSPDSLGIYVTYQPKTGRQDAERNCISNVRPQGLDYLDAARKTAWLISQALWRKVSGVNLKDESDAVALRAQGLQRLSGGA